MKSVLGQLQAWRFRERAIRVVWGGARWFAVVGSVLAVACVADWLVDRYSGSEAWRKFFHSSRVFAPSDPLSAGETPFWFRLVMTLGQLALAGVLFYYLLVRPWARTPPVDDLATQAEKAFPAFDHRLVTAIQLNRPAADTRGMSETLIAEVTREAGEIASKHNLLSLVDYRRLAWAAAAAGPVLAAWVVFFLVSPTFAGVLVRRQALADAEIPRDVRLENATRDVWPTGNEVTVRYKVMGKWNEGMVGVLRVVPDGQPEEFYDLTFEKADESDPGVAYFTKTLPPASRDFSFQARLADGRTKQAGRVSFEAPPQLGNDDPSKSPPLTAEQVLPVYLGVAPDKRPFTRKGEGWNRGEVIDALPQSGVIVEARFNKPIKKDSKDPHSLHARLVPIERDGVRERELPAVLPFEVSDDRLSASFGFYTTPRLIGYRIELEDDRGFRNPVPIRRNVRMWEDRPPVVEFRPESTRNPDPDARDGEGSPKDYEWDMPLAPDGLVMVIYGGRSDAGVRTANIRYRVIPKGVQFDLYPDEYKRIQHPREDPNLIVYDRLPLTRFRPDPKRPDQGAFVADLGLFAHSFTTTARLWDLTFTFEHVPRFDRNKVNVEFYPSPSRNPAAEPGGLEAAGRRNFEVAGLLKKVPERQADGKVVMKTAKIEEGDTVELYLEVFDKVALADAAGKTRLDKAGNPIPDTSRPAGYTREAKRKIVMSEVEVASAIRQRDEARQKLQDKLRDLATDQADVFRPKKKPTGSQ